MCLDLVLLIPVPGKLHRGSTSCFDVSYLVGCTSVKGNPWVVLLWWIPLVMFDHNLTNM